MRSLVYSVLLCALSAIAGAQSHWHHEMLQDDAVYFENQYLYSQISPSGAAVYCAARASVGSEHAYCNKTDLNSLYVKGQSTSQCVAINRYDQVAFSALGTSSWHVIAGGHDYFTDVLNPSRAYNAGVGFVDSTGLPVWSYQRLEKASDLYRGSRKLSPDAPYWYPGMIGVSDDDHVVWEAYTWRTGAPPVEDILVDDYNLTADVLGFNRSPEVHSAKPNSRGDILWRGSGDSTGSEMDMFLNKTNLTHGKLEEGAFPSPLGINSNGTILWIAGSSTQPVLYRDWTDISTPVFGNHRYTFSTSMLAESGDVAWTARDDVTGQWAIYLNDRNISMGMTDWLGAEPRLFGVDRYGDVVWGGQGDGTDGLMHLFVNQFDLTKDALTDGTHGQSTPLAVGPNGHILWATSLASTGHYGIFLSTPVPEPSVLLLGLPVLVLAIRRRTTSSA